MREFVSELELKALKAQYWRDGKKVVMEEKQRE